MMKKYFEMLKQKGADVVTEINPRTIITAPWVIYKCQFGCGRYGNSYCCPPKTPNYKKTQEIIDSYEKAILFRCHDMGIVTPMAVEVAKELFLDGYYKVIAFGSGQCKVCNKCNPVSCNFPEKIAPSMEACGIDVFATVRANGFEIQTPKHYDEPQNHFGLLLVDYNFNETKTFAKDDAKLDVFYVH